MIKQTILWSNGMVMTHDENQEDDSMYQGKYTEVRDRVLADADENTKFLFGDWGNYIRAVSKEQWANNQWGVYPEGV